MWRAVALWTLGPSVGWRCLLHCIHDHNLTLTLTPQSLNPPAGLRPSVLCMDRGRVPVRVRIRVRVLRVRVALRVKELRVREIRVRVRFK